MKDKRKIVVYVSGAYSGNSKEEIARNIQLAREAAIQLWEIGFAVICPHLNTIYFEEDCNCTYDDYLNADKEIVKRCDAIFMLENWKSSKGARVEKLTAQDNNIPIFYKTEEVEAWYENQTD